MKIITGIVIVYVFLTVACNNNGGTTKTNDSTTINTTNSNAADGGPNNGLGGTNTYNRNNDTAVHDTTPKK